MGWLVPRRLVNMLTILRLQHTNLPLPPRNCGMNAFLRKTENKPKIHIKFEIDFIHQCTSHHRCVYSFGYWLKPFLCTELPWISTHGSDFSSLVMTGAWQLSSGPIRLWGEIRLSACGGKGGLRDPQERMLPGIALLECEEGNVADSGGGRACAPSGLLHRAFWWEKATGVRKVK